MHVTLRPYNDEDFIKLCEALESNLEVSYDILSTGIYDPMLDLEGAHYAVELEKKYGGKLRRNQDADVFHTYRLRG